LTPPFLSSTQPINQFLNQNNKPTIINISTLHHTVPSPNYLHYPASKPRLKLIIQTISIQYPQYPIPINNISPPPILTEHTEQKFSD
ncbi:SDR family NAD(P)-dependent oxidoreductase, partial [Staphylococcus epidermidis]|uniref:SDR family NAD(P)-dependent oxidoreductase n=1 Tax=Staphylococcus epidermidis TaxID=1282 RepID=UPI0011A66C50